MDLSVLPQRILNKINFEPMSGCWLWGGALSHGYGNMWADGTWHPAHRWIYERLQGVDVPDDLDMDHLCRIPSCVNPDHLQPVTHRENIYRGVSKGARGKATHCLRGHLLEGKNVKIEHKADGSIQRHCNACQHECRVARRAAAKAS